MKTLLICLMFMTFATSLAEAQSAPDQPNQPSFLVGVKATMQKYLGRPYVWGSSGIKSFDCSGFVWRVLYENGVLMKRTTARKFFLTLPPATKTDQSAFGTLVFFDDLKHMGIVDDADTFYHSEVSIGTNRSKLNSFWRKKVYGYRKLPVPETN